MEQAKKSKTAMVILDIIAALLPLAVMVLGIGSFFNGFMPTLSHGLMFFLWPGLAAWHCIRKQHSEAKWYEKVFYIVLVWIILIFAFVFTWVTGFFHELDRTEGDAATRNFCTEVENIVSPLSFGSAEQFEYYEYNKRAFFFSVS